MYVHFVPNFYPIHFFLLQIVNLYANDSQRIFDAICIAPLLLGSPLMAIAATIYCTYILGPWALLGSLVIGLFYPYQVNKTAI